MNEHIRPQLLHFYFGSINDDSRLQIERQMLVDPEWLVCYLDLKRELESAPAVPHLSPLGYRRFDSYFQPRKKLFFTLALGLTAAAVLALFAVFLGPSRPETLDPVKSNGVLFDSSAELPAASNVL